MTYVMFALGLAGLFVGGEFLVRGAVGLARRLGISPLVIGLTVVGFGTSTPELLVSLQAALAGSPAIAIGNVVGSNIANILLILGVTALIMPVPMRLADTRRDFAVMIGVTLLLWALLFGAVITAWQGAFFVILLGAYLWFSLRSTQAAPEDHPPATQKPVWRSVLEAAGGLILLMVGARFLVESATEIARAFGISEAVIGLTIVAVGTSLPELAASAMAAYRKHPEIAVGNILGSNIFNILAILGVTAMIYPIPVDPRFARLDMPAAMAAALAMLALAALAGRVSRLGGAALIAGYAGYLAVAS
ncbi:MAG: calcium/sodium antiporter [Rhodobacteraceae bacterium]|nr:calcium/sodium antiporter [Paracoccaceae bacterium]